MPDDLVISIDEGPISEVIEGPTSDVTDIFDPIIGIAVENPDIEQIPTTPPIESVTIVEKGDQGPPGPPGPPGTGGGDDLDIAEVVATENIPILKFVTAGGKIADSNNTAHIGHVLGITLSPVNTGFIVQAVVEGEVTDPSWSWGVDTKLFLNGTSLSSIAPSNGFSQQVGISRNAQTVFIRLEVPIRL